MKRLVLLVLASGLAGTAAEAADLTIEVSGLRSRAGNLGLCLWSNGNGFPDCSKLPRRQQRVVSAVDADKPIRFKGLPAGTYAISVVHDENANGQFDLNFLGIPAKARARQTRLCRGIQRRASPTALSR